LRKTSLQFAVLSPESFDQALQTIDLFLRVVESRPREFFLMALESHDFHCPLDEDVRLFKELEDFAWKRIGKRDCAARLFANWTDDLFAGGALELARLTIAEEMAAAGEHSTTAFEAFETEIAPNPIIHEVTHCAGTFCLMWRPLIGSPAQLGLRVEVTLLMLMLCLRQ
jgi:hypothetical protein